MAIDRLLSRNMSDTRDPIRSIRIPDDLYGEIRRVAEEEDRTVSATIREALREYAELRQ